MASIINRRFLDVSLSVQGVANQPPATPAPVNGTQYIVGDAPAGAFASATAGSLARYDGYKQTWVFTKPAAGQMELLNVDTKEIMAFDGTAWVVKANLGGGDGSGTGPLPETAKPVNTIVTSGATLPATAEVGAKFLNTADGKLYTATAENSWGAGVAVAAGERYASVTDKKLYEIVDGTLTGKTPADGVIFLSRTDDVVIGYDGVGNKFIVVGGSGEVTGDPGENPVIPAPSGIGIETESHTLTSGEETAKKFNLAKAVATGKETAVLLFVGGVAQVAGTDFTVSGNEVSWTGKGLDGIVATGDIFVVSYPVAG